MRIAVNFVIRRLKENNIDEATVMPEGEGLAMGDTEYADRGILGESISPEAMDPKNDPNIAVEEVGLYSNAISARTNGIRTTRKTWTSDPPTTSCSPRSRTKTRGRDSFPR